MVQRCGSGSLLQVIARNLLLAAISLVVFFGLFEGALALLGVAPALEREDPFVGFASQVRLYEQSPQSADVLVTAKGRRGHFNVQRFAREKPAGAYRIFCLGGSTTYGRPYDDRTSFCGWLRALLPVADPSREWEVVNAGGISYASYRVAALMEELSDYEPDLFVLYTGHNEFLERRTYSALFDAPPWQIELRFWLNRTRVYTFLRQLISAATGRGAEAKGRDVLPEDVDAILDESAGLAWYSRETLQHDAVLRHFRLNLERILERARASDASVLLVRPASNLAACSPFKSEHAMGIPLDVGDRYKALIAESERASAAGDHEEALAVLARAGEIDELAADLHYRRGRTLQALGRHEDARAAFERAREEDVCPLRARRDFADAVVAAARAADLPLVDFAAIAAARAERGIPGQDLFLDHVHPTIEANGILARAIVDALAEQGIVRPVAGWPDEIYPAAKRAVLAGVDARAQGLAQKNLGKVFEWAGKTEEAHRAALRGIELVGAWHWEVHSVAARTAAKLGRSEAAIAHSRDALALAPDNAHEHNRLGQLLALRGELEEARTHLERATQTQPRYAAAHSNLAEVLEQLGHEDEALAEHRSAVRLDPRPEHRIRLARALLSRGRSAAARTQLEEALRDDPARADAAVELADLYAGAGHPDQARSLAEQALFLARRSHNAEIEERARRRLAALPPRTP
jgi:tetratricopeptide (TPR) repeat protein